MIVTCVHVHVLPEHINDFIEASLLNHEASVRESDNLRFDILRSVEDPSHFLLYEAYESEEAAAAHKNTLHYIRWRETVAPWMASPRRGVPNTVVAPKDRNEW